MSTSVPTKPPASAPQMLMRRLAFEIDTAACDQREVHQPLRGVAQELVGDGVDLLGVEADVVGERDQLVHQRRGLVAAPDPGERVGEPERAAEEGALAAAQPVLSAVAGEQRTAPELAPYGVDRRAQPAGVRAS